MLFKLIVIMILGNNSISQHEYIYQSSKACDLAATALASKELRTFLVAPVGKGAEKDLRIVAVCFPDPVDRV